LGPYLGGDRVRLAMSALQRVFPLAYAGDGLTAFERALARTRGIVPADRPRQVVRLTVAPEDLIFDRSGKIWFEGDVGPFSVPPKASDLARPGWSAFVTAAKAAGRWHLLEVGAVYP